MLDCVLTLNLQSGMACRCHPHVPAAEWSLHATAPACLALLIAAQTVLGARLVHGSRHRGPMCAPVPRLTPSPLAASQAPASTAADLTGLLLPLPQNCDDDAFLDAFLSAARLEMFMPGVDIVSKEDHVSELYIIVRGSVKVSARAQLHMHAGAAPGCTLRFGAVEGKQPRQSGACAAGHVCVLHVAAEPA